MGKISDAFASAWRDFVTAGVASSGLYEPEKSEIRAIGPLIEEALGLGALGGVDVTKATRAALDGDLAWAESSTALVYADATDANNDLYVKVGASGSGSWTLTTILRDVIGAAGAAGVALAEEWAENPEDVPVTDHPGQYSAKHHALKADASRVALLASGSSILAMASAAATLAQGYADVVANTLIAIESMSYRLTALEARSTPVNGDVIQAEIMGGALACSIAAAGNANTIPANGKILRLRFKGLAASGTIDPTKLTLTVVDPGFGTDRVYRLNNVVRTLRVTGLYRASYPNASVPMVQVVGSDLDTYWALSESVFVSSRCYNVQVQAGFYGACTNSTLGLVTNSSTRPYEMPQLDLVAQPPIMRLGSSGLSYEWVVSHAHARFGQPVAAMETYIIDNTASPGTANRITSVSNAMTASTRFWPHTPPVFAGTFASTAGLTDGNSGGLSVKVYPWMSGPDPWDLAANGAASVYDSSIPAYWPVCIDSDGSYRTARAYVSHTGAQIGSPTFTTSALAAYVPGTTAAYATVAAALAAGQTWNNTGANRTRTHNDCGGLEIVIPSGTTIAGFGASLVSYVCGGGPVPRLTIETGASRSNTGLGPGAQKAYRHIDIDGLGLFPTTGASHTLIDGQSTGASSSAPANLSGTVITVVRNCQASSAGDTLNQIALRAGYYFGYNNDFTGPEFFRPNVTLYNASIIHGGSYNSSFRSTPSLMDGMGRIIGARMWQLVPAAESALRTFHFQIGQIFAFNRFDYNGGSGANPIVGSFRAAIGARGLAFIGNLIRPTGNTSPALQIQADYATTDRPAMLNVVVMCNSITGNRYNRGYLEVGANTDIKEIYEFNNAFDSQNNKSDYMDPDAGGPLTQNGARTGNFALRFGTDRGYNVTAQTSANSSTYGSTSFLGEAAPIGSSINVGRTNMYINDTSASGTNAFSDLGDYTPKAALQNLIPSGRAPWRNDYLGRVIPNNGTGAAGALQVA